MTNIELSSATMLSLAAFAFSNRKTSLYNATTGIASARLEADQASLYDMLGTQQFGC